jgi:hypothetical protein
MLENSNLCHFSLDISMKAWVAAIFVNSYKFKEL